VAQKMYIYILDLQGSDDSAHVSRIIEDTVW
jgi:hypothetical protein